jgi:hypothetical protein
MPESRKPNETDAQVLARLEVRDFDEPIFEMSRAEIREHFGFNNGNINVSELLYNLIWQDRNFILEEELGQVNGNIRSYWYQRVKPLMSRTRVKGFAKKYGSMIDKIGDLVVDQQLMSYREFGFRDEGQANRAVGTDNPYVILASEKLGHLPLIERLARDYGVSHFAMGGQPSVLSLEYFVRELAAAGVTNRRIDIFTIVDWDPSGYSIAQNFRFGLAALGYQGDIHSTDLVHPDRVPDEQIRLGMYTLPRGKSQKERNANWIEETGGLRGHGDTTKGGKGLEADAMNWEQLTEHFDRLASPLLEVPRQTIVRRRLNRELDQVLAQTLVRRLLA